MTASDPSAWIGHTETVADRLDPSHTQRIAATLGEPHPGEGADLPWLWQWAFFMNPVGVEALGPDGHPERGGFLPEAAGRNRMWAGGRLSFHQPLKVGVEASRTSTVIAVKDKVGSTGALRFVTVQHEYRQAGELAISEQQDIVYREPSPPKLVGTQPEPEGQWREAITPSAERLFRYSAVTFNTHRIHYDYPYVTDTEGYPGLVVHGPMISTYMLAGLLHAHPERRVKEYAYRGLRPLISPAEFHVGGTIGEDGRAQVWAAQDGTLAHQGEVTFE